SELVGIVLAEEQLPLGVRLPRVRLVFESRLVDAGVARRAAIDPSHRLIVGVAIELLEYHLADPGDLRLPLVLDERRRRRGTRELAEGDGLELLLQLATGSRQLGERVLRALHGPALGRDLCPQILDVGLGSRVHLLALVPSLLPLLDALEDPLRRAAVVLGVVEEKAQL